MQEILKSLHSLNLSHPKPAIIGALEHPKNKRLLEYVTNDAFGAHVFPGDLAHYSRRQFFIDMNNQLTQQKPIHLWVNLPLCEQRCFFCQFPIAIARNKANLHKATQKWLNANLKEAQLWLDAVPLLKTTPIGEFNILGGTPTLLSNEQIEQLVSFYKENFNFRTDTTIRIEGTASTYTVEKLQKLKSLGISKVSSGIQSFDDAILSQANCVHTGHDSIEYIKNAQQCHFASVNADFIYGLANQSVEQFLKDIQMAIDLNVSCIVITKLHLKTFSETRTAVSGEKEALWQIPEARY